LLLSACRALLRDVDGIVARRVEVEFPVSTQYMVGGEILEPARQLTVETGPRLDLIRG